MKLNEVQLARMLDQARKLRDEEKFLHGAQVYIRLILAEPSFVLPYIELSSLYIEAGQVAPAIKVLHDAEAHIPENEDIIFLIGCCYLRLDQYDRALDFLGRLADRKLPHVHFNMGIAWFQKNDVARAEEHFRLTLRYDPKFPRVNESLGELLIQRQAYDEAIEYLKRGVTADPYSSLNHHLLGIAHSRLGRWSKAYHEFVLSIDMDPAESANWARCGEALLHLHRIDEAEPYLRKALELEPQSIDALVALGHLLTVRGDSDRAREFLLRASSIDAESARARQATWWKFRRAARQSRPS